VITVQTDATTLRDAFRDLERAFPGETRNALIRMKNGLRKHSRLLVATGRSGVLKHDAGWRKKSGVSMKLRPNPLFGGVLNKSITARNDAKSITLGWPNRLRFWADNLQSAQTQSWTAKQESYLRSKGISQPVIDRGYDRPAREVWNPMINAAGTQAYIIGTVVDQYDKLMRRAERKAAARRRSRARLVRDARRVVKRTRRVAVRGARNVRRAGRVLRKEARSAQRTARRVVRKEYRAAQRSVRRAGRVVSRTARRTERNVRRTVRRAMR